MWQLSFIHLSTVSGDKGLLVLKLSFPPSALPAYDCFFEDGLCVWVQGAEDELDWLSMSGPTQTANTGPAGDHTSGKGHYNTKAEETS